MTESTAANDESGEDANNETNEDANSETNEEGLTEADLAPERAERLDTENRPDQAEVDNTDREFDPEKGMFTDSEGHDEAEKKFPAGGEQGA